MPIRYVPAVRIACLAKGSIIPHLFRNLATLKRTPDFNFVMIFFRTKTLNAMRLLALVAVLGPLASACSHVPLTTLVKLRDFDLFRTDPDGIRVAVRYPDGIRIPKGGAGMHLTVKMKSDGAVVLEENVAFEELNSKSDKAELGDELQVGMRIGVYRLPAENVPFFKSFQEFMLSKSNAERETMEGSMSVSVKGCRVSEELPEKIPVSTYLKTVELGSYVTLLRDVDLKEVMAEIPDPDNPGLASCGDLDPPETD